jgi:hypothetical protein
MPRIPDNNQLQWETVGLPLARGVDLRTPGRAIAQQRLQTFENGRFAEADAGLVRRRGHEAVIPRRPGILADQEIRQRAEWVFGEGYLDADGIRTQSLEPGKFFGLATRDSEVLSWDGHRLWSWPEETARGGYWHTPLPAVLPHATTRPVAKYATAQKFADLGVGTHHAVVAWVDPLTGSAMVSVYDAKTWAPLLADKVLSFADPIQVRVMPAGEWVHILCSSTTELKMFSIHSDTAMVVRPGVATFPPTNNYFDMRRCSSERWVVVSRNTTTFDVSLRYLRNDGTVDTTYTPGVVTLDTTGVGLNAQAGPIAVGWHPKSNELALLWSHRTTTSTAFVAIYSANGTRLTGRLEASTEGSTWEHVTIEGEYALMSPGRGAFRWFLSNADDESLIVAGTVDRVSGVHADTPKRFWAQLSHHAFRVGNLVFCGARSAYYVNDTASRLQYTYFLLDHNLKPVGCLERGTAAGPMLGLPSIHADHSQDFNSPTRFHGPVTYRQRLDSSMSDQFDEESIKLLELDFLPRLRTAQIGRTTYIAGAQLSAYDGKQVVEQGHHIFPEKVEVSNVAGPGITGTYRYRARWGWKNAQGEEEVSATLLGGAITPFNQKVRVFVRTDGLTRKEGKYLLLYRNADNGTLWHLVTSRDPTSPRYVANDPSVRLIQYDDDMPDNELLLQELDRDNAGLLGPFPAPASQVIASGRDRLWLAGGEIPTGSMQPSLLHSVGNIAEFNVLIQTTVDQGAEPVTAFSFLGHSTLVFRRTRIDAFEADGPNNQAQGSFDYPRSIASDVGAVSQESVAVTTAGVFFQSAAGMRLLATNYQVTDVGGPVKPAAVGADIRAAVVVPDEQEVRFYRADGPALVFFYDRGEWGTWTGLEAVGAALSRDNLAVMATGEGYLWVEREGLNNDGGRGYEMVVKTASLHRGSMQDFHRIRRVGLLGDAFGVCTLHFRVYLDDSPSPADDWYWEVPGEGEDADLNPTTLGGAGGTLGDGELLGDPSGASGIQIARVRELGDRRRLSVQKCSRIAVEIRDGAPHNSGVGLTEVALELGTRGGLTRLPARTHTS